MSTMLTLYLEHHDGQIWHNISNQNPYDGYDYTTPQIFPEFPYDFPNTKRMLKDWLKRLTQTNANQNQIYAEEMSTESQMLYQKLSNEVTGHDNGIYSFSIALNDLIDTYNANPEQNSEIHRFLKKLFDAHYWQIGYSLINIQPNHIQANQPALNKFRIVGWLDCA